MAFLLDELGTAQIGLGTVILHGPSSQRQPGLLDCSQRWIPSNDSNHSLSIGTYRVGLVESGSSCVFLEKLPTTAVSRMGTATLQQTQILS